MSVGIGGGCGSLSCVGEASADNHLNDKIKNGVDNNNDPRNGIGGNGSEVCRVGLGGHVPVGSEDKGGSEDNSVVVGEGVCKSRHVVLKVHRTTRQR